MNTNVWSFEPDTPKDQDIENIINLIEMCSLHCKDRKSYNNYNQNYFSALLLGPPHENGREDEERSV